MKDIKTELIYNKFDLPIWENIKNITRIWIVLLKTALTPS